MFLFSPSLWMILLQSITQSCISSLLALAASTRTSSVLRRANVNKQWLPDTWFPTWLSERKEWKETKLLKRKGLSFIQMGFRLGKIPSRLLESHVLSQLGSRSSAVVVGPAIGEDSAVLRLSSPLLAAKSDPVTGAAHNAGKLVVHVNANDLAASGALPQFFLLTALFPEGSPVELAQSLQKQVHEACLSLGVSIVGGHTEMTDAVSRPVLVGCMLGPLITREPIKTAGARPGDLLVLTKVWKRKKKKKKNEERVMIFQTGRRH
jgi:hypothetical protein